MLAFTDYLLSRARIEDAQEATRWLLGSLNGRGWEDVVAAARRCSRCSRPRSSPPAAPLRALELGDDAAHGLGAARRARAARAGRARRRARLGRRRSRSGRSCSSRSRRRRSRAGSRAPPEPTLVCSALTGAVLVLGADIAAQRLVPVDAAARRRHDRRVRRALPRVAAGAPMEGGARMSGPSPLRARDVTLAYDGHVVAARPLGRRSPRAASPRSSGPNACGKSTLLRALVRMLKPRDRARCCSTARRSRSLPTKQVARRLGLLPQSSTAPDGITVADLVARGRHPHQTLLRQWSQRGRARRARGDGADATSTTSPTGRSTSSRAASASASGSRWRSRRRRRCCCSTSRRRSSTSRTRWRCSTSARELHASGRTLVAVLHDLNHACRYATHLIAMRDGAIVAAGRAARRSSTRRWSSASSGCPARSCPCPETGAPMVVPAARRAPRQSSSRSQSPVRSQ